MWEAAAIVVAALVVAGAALRGWSWFLRWRVLRTVPGDSIRRAERGVSLRVLVSRTGALPGMNPRRANRTRGDLVLAGDRLLLTSGRGTLADLGPGRGRPFTSVRCTGPGRLVIEGDVPRPQGEPATFRIEIKTPDAASWARDLEPFVQPAAEGAPRYATVPPWMDGPGGVS